MPHDCGRASCRREHTYERGTWPSSIEPITNELSAVLAWCATCVPLIVPGFEFGPSLASLLAAHGISRDGGEPSGDTDLLRDLVTSMRQSSAVAALAARQPRGEA